MGGKKGLIYVFSGEGKGKTSAALGVAVRAVCAGMKVVWVSWYKGCDWSISEKRLEKLLGKDNLVMFWMGKGFYIKGKRGEIKQMDFDTPQGHKKAALEALNLCDDILCGKVEKVPRGVSLLVMDEVVNAVKDGLIEEEDVFNILEKRGKVHVILTGRGVSKGLIERADLVTEMEKVKHPYDRGEVAVKGLDF